MEHSVVMPSSGSESMPNVIHLDSTQLPTLDSSLPTTSPQVRPPITRKRGRSDVWQHFTRIENVEDPNEPKATCDYCAFEVMQDEDNEFGPYLREVGQGIPTLHDWETIKVFVKFLKLFYDTTLRVSGSIYATSNLFIREISDPCQYGSRCVSYSHIYCCF
ncbi:hypothetical protein F2P56_002542 [Juglans regia]|uniref:Zinc finger BED domain-containing protein RICESLEEPER 2-like n=1 Tax=Juglans regia TaxID=51240 RepID=A0A833YDF0_JUGRE|nr:hypothetical protein F2P56_002542 [Juglans regia]